MEARKESKWNLAMAGLAEDVANADDEDDRAELVQEHAELLVAAGFADKALEVLSTVAPSLEELSLDDIPGLRLLLEQAKMQARAGRRADIEHLLSRVEQLQPRGPRETNVKAQVVDLLVQTLDQVVDRAAPQRMQISDYARWRLHAVTRKSKHSAVYHFRSDDASRGTPIRKGRGGRMVWSKTWHTTLLAEVGEARNKEGPLPWIERDYTPISTAHDWEQGRCDILIKVYLDPDPPGLATQWLHRVSAGVAAPEATGAAASGAAAEGDGVTSVTAMDVTDAAGAEGDGVASVAAIDVTDAAIDVTDAAGAEGSAFGIGADVAVWLSRPMKTLHVPSLALDDKYINRKHSSVLLLVAGTGVVAVPQVLHHANLATCFARRPPVTQPVTVIYSCRTDDALLIPELAGWCREGSLARCTVLLTAAQPVKTPFPQVADVDVTAAFAQLDNAVCMNARLSPEILRAELARKEKPLRVVVSGPESFNAACKSMLKQLDDDLGAEAVTILNA